MLKWYFPVNVYETQVCLLFQRLNQKTTAEGAGARSKLGFWSYTYLTFVRTKTSLCTSKKGGIRHVLYVLPAFFVLLYKGVPQGYSIR